LIAKRGRLPLSSRERALPFDCVGSEAEGRYGGVLQSAEQLEACCPGVTLHELGHGPLIITVLRRVAAVVCARR